ncbi:hypothetical protein [Xenorhabdus sp. GDc328]|uniref:hypothetical protein n=2 Tax=Xenorhabdus TaxID=626 RepID=UPI000A6633D1|nr:hypothetical protein [Xenorhabdus sp. GDc328]
MNLNKCIKNLPVALPIAVEIANSSGDDVDGRLIYLASIAYQYRDRLFNIGNGNTMSINDFNSEDDVEKYSDKIRAAGLPIRDEFNELTDNIERCLEFCETVERLLAL